MATKTSTLHHYLVEWYQPDFTTTQLEEATSDLAAETAIQRAAGVGVHLLLAMAAPNDEVLYSVFAAHSPEVVIETCAHAGRPIERITDDVQFRILAEGLAPAASASPSPDDGGHEAIDSHNHN